MLSPVVSITYQEKLSEQYIISSATVAESLERLYHDINYRHEMSLAAYKNAARPEYSWRAIAFRWRDVFQEELARLSSKHKVAS